MSVRIDHMKAARANLAVVGTEGMRSTEALVTVTAAQVHATLALVEQQRIANFIAFYNVSPDDAGVLSTAGVSFAEVLRQIREGLGV